VETVAKINAFDWRKAGLGFLSYGVKPDFDARFHYYLDAFEWARGESENPIVEAARDWLIVHKPDEEEPETLSWGDARLGNLIFRDFKVVGVIDWEMVSLGPPLQDLGWWFWVERALFGHLHTGNPSDPKSLPGFPSREATLERWSELTGYSTKHIDFYEVLSGFRLACHLQKMGNLFIELGVAGPESKWASNNLATQALAAMIGVDHPPPEPLPSLPLPGPG
jgi:aminoglycoside phosphotransferase (APT) family kinase protein